MPTLTSTTPGKAGCCVLYPLDLQTIFSVNNVSIWRWERAGKLPPRDAHVGGEAVGWRPQTIERVLSGEWKPTAPQRRRA